MKIIQHNVLINITRKFGTKLSQQKQKFYFKLFVVKLLVPLTFFIWFCVVYIDLLRSLDFSNIMSYIWIKIKRNWGFKILN